jgi:hypothetical protein
MVFQSHYDRPKFELPKRAELPKPAETASKQHVQYEISCCGTSILSDSVKIQNGDRIFVEPMPGVCQGILGLRQKILVLCSNQ